MYMQACLAGSIIICMHACLARNYPEALSHCGRGHGLTSVAQLSVINIANIRSAGIRVLSLKRRQRHAVAERPGKGGLQC